jgi:8-oxo-dGTP pyrophosphatase MutT (NUDIX family)
MRLAEIVAEPQITEPIFGDEVLAGLDRPPVPAAVLVPVVLGEEPSILLTKRTSHLAKHAGQISFPGGRIDPEDSGPEAAALREAQEEIGLDAGAVEVLGRLRDHVTGTGYRITPILATVRPALTYQLSPHEVDAIFELPMRVVLDPDAPRRQRQHVRGVWREYWVWPHPEHFIWGATAAILVQLARRLREKVGLPEGVESREGVG